VPESIDHACPAEPVPVPAKGPAKELPREADGGPAKRVIVEILRQAADKANRPGLERSALTYYFWLAHLYYARGNPSYLTEWPLVRAAGGPEILGASTLLCELAEDGLVRTAHTECGPFPVTLYVATPKGPASELPLAAVEAIQQAVTAPSIFQGWPWGRSVRCSRAWATARDGGEMDIYLDLIPEEQYEERQRQLDGLKEALGGLFS
jgi:hypothetical protein